MPQPTNSRRNRRQKVKAQYAKAREEAQLLGVIPTTPQGAVRDEVAVPEPGSGADPGLVRQAVRRGWAVPEHKKPVIVDELVRAVETEGLDVNAKIAAARTLRMVDRDQWERDNPDAAGKSKGSVTVTQGQQVVTADGVLKAVLAAAPTDNQRRLAELEAAEGEVRSGTGQAEVQTGGGDTQDARRVDGGVQPGPGTG